MPFISEELYQRLPGQKEHPSICVSSYPTKQQNKVYRNEDIEKDVKFVQKVIDTVRSTRADYNLPNKVREHYTFAKQVIFLISIRGLH